MGDRGIRWGWQIRCMAKDCPRKHEQWGDSTQPGPPSLWSPGVYTSGALKGWYLGYRDGQDYRAAYDGSIGHFAYCPEHAVLPTTWLAEYKAWEARRGEIGKTVALGLLARLAEWLSPQAERQKEINRQTGVAVWDWMQKNPAPRPPWMRTQ